MRLDLQTRDFVRSVAREDVEAYLRANRWRRVSEVAEAGAYWKHEVGDGAVLIPTTREIDDYELRLAVALESLAESEGRTFEKLGRDIALVRYDVTRLRSELGDGFVGSVPIAAGTKLVRQAEVLLAAAACATLERRRAFVGRYPAPVNEYLRQAELGQTERGSYIVTVLTHPEPLYSESVPAMVEIWDEPFSRSVLKTLGSALAGLRNAIEGVARGAGIDAFEPAVAQGASANLCDAVAGLIKEAPPEATVSISTTWAPIRPEASSFPQATFGADDVAVLSEGARFLRAENATEGIPIIGVVVNLHREQRQEDGLVTVTCVIENVHRRVQVPLTTENYGLAVEAHMQRRPVVFQADVQRDGRIFRATNVREFRVG